MKGIVFTEFLDMVEDRFGFDEVDALIAECELSTDGAYTAVGTYDYRELVSLASRLSERSGTPLPELLATFGEHLFGRFHELYPAFFQDIDTASEFLAGIEDTIHTEVRKLYPDAELPRFIVEALEDDGLQLEYHSPRPFVDFAEGLLRGCLQHFGEDRTITREDLPAEDETVARFLLG